MNRKIVFTFADSNGKEFTLSYSYAANEIEQSDITALKNAIIANGSIFANVPVTCKSIVVYDITATSYEV